MSEKQEQTNYRRQGVKGTLFLLGTLDISAATELQMVSKKALADFKAKELSIDFSGVERLDVAALQILCALQRDVRSGDRLCQTAGLNGAALETIQRLGVAL